MLPACHNCWSIFAMCPAQVSRKIFFCRPLRTTTKAGDVLQVVSDFFEKNNLSWADLIGVCIDGAVAMIGSRCTGQTDKSKHSRHTLFTSPTGPCFRDSAEDLEYCVGSHYQHCGLHQDICLK